MTKPNFTVRVRKINSAKLKGVATVTINDLMEIDGFKIIDGSKGLFVSVPSHKGTVMDENNQKVEKYFDDVRFPGEDGQAFGDELKQAILDEFNNYNHSSDRATTAKAHAAPQNNETRTTKVSSNPPRNKKPLWGF